jgi:hypothetical protein
MGVRFDRGQFDSRPCTEQGIIDVSVTDSVPDLSWLADSPLFIDSQQIGVFYDAVVGPAFRTVELQISASQTEQREKSADRHLNTGLPALFPWLKVDAGIEAQRTVAKGRQDGQSITLRPVDNAARQLVQLSLHYLVNQPNRICVVGQDTPLPGAEVIATSPRMIAFVDVPPGTRFLPQAAGGQGGQSRGRCHRRRWPTPLDRLPNDIWQRHDAAP